MPKAGAPAGGPPPSFGGVGIGGMNKINRGEEAGGNKFNKVMDWGTPRLVTK